MYQFKLLKVRKICPAGTTLSPCYSPNKALSLLPTTKCAKGVKPICNANPHIKCEIDESGKIMGLGESDKILLTKDNDNNIIISSNNETQITNDCKNDIESKILSKIKYT